MNDTPKDTIYAQPLGSVAEFRFDEAVANVFPDMIRRSVPGYLTIVENIGLIAEQFYQPGSHCYDLGCSLGAVSFSIRRQLPHAPIIAVDNSEAMLASCRSHLQRVGQLDNLNLVCSDIREAEIRDASVVVLNFTLQFISLKEREAVLRRIFAGMVKGGVLILSEKVQFAQPDKQQLFTELHHSFKRINGYSDLEISQKRSALETVLLPETQEKHRQRLEQVGFHCVETWFQCFNFVSLMAVKS